MMMEKNGSRSRDGTRVYKIGRYASRKDAKRHHVANVLAASDEEAINEFMEYVGTKDDNQKSRYVLYSGDWKKTIITFI